MGRAACLIREAYTESIDESDELLWWHLGVDYKQARAVKGWNQWNPQAYDNPVEVVLDSGADCHVLPMWYYADDLGTIEFPELRMVIADVIRTTEF